MAAKRLLAILFRQVDRVNVRDDVQDDEEDDPLRSGECEKCVKCV